MNKFRHKLPKLDAAQAEEIRQLYASAPRDRSGFIDKLANRFGVSRNTIWKIGTNQNRCYPFKEQG
jgi:hypothetical protein